LAHDGQQDACHDQRPVRVEPIDEHRRRSRTQRHGDRAKSLLRSEHPRHDVGGDQSLCVSEDADLDQL
jgi:hypothetical protein